jgi:hypothetical protein
MEGDCVTGSVRGGAVAPVAIFGAFAMDGMEAVGSSFTAATGFSFAAAFAGGMVVSAIGKTLLCRRIGK